MNSGEKSSSVDARVTELGWRGNEAGEVLQDLTAQVRKLVVRIFMVVGFLGSGRFRETGCLLAGVRSE